MIMANPWERLLTTSATDTSFASKVPTATEPSGDGVIDLAPIGGCVQRRAMFIFFGGDADGDQFAARIIGWSFVGEVTSKMWVPTVLAELTCTLGTATGVSGGKVTATELFVDTIAPVANRYPVDAEGTPVAAVDRLQILSPTDNLIAHAIIELVGCQKIEVTFDMLTGGDRGNALVKLLHD